jgi:hypothetical protein
MAGCPFVSFGAAVQITNLGDDVCLDALIKARHQRGSKLPPLSKAWPKKLLTRVNFRKIGVLVVPSGGAPQRASSHPGLALRARP